MEKSLAETGTTIGGVPEDEAVNTVANDIFASSSVADTVQSEAPATEATETTAEVPADKDARTDLKEEAGTQSPKSRVYITMSRNLAKALDAIEGSHESRLQSSMIFKSMVAASMRSAASSFLASSLQRPSHASDFPVRSRFTLANLPHGRTVLFVRA